MIQYASDYLVDASALWRLLRDPKILDLWEEQIDAGALRVCESTRVEFLFSATSPGHRELLAEQLDAMCSPARVPKDAWRWVETAQYQLAQRGRHRSAGPLELLVCATAVHYGLTVLHVDDDFATVSRVLPELDQQDVRHK
jgi:predicted nucleic acid-binding protein